MTDQATDFLKQYQALAQQSWDAWMQSLQSAPVAPFSYTPPSPGDDLLRRALGGLKSYTDWLQSAAVSGIAGQLPQADWQQSLRQLFMGGQPFAQAFAGIDSAAAQGFAQQWQAWLQAMQPQGLGDWSGMLNWPTGAGPVDVPAFGYTRERQLQQQALLEAMRVYAETSSRYQSLLLRANAKGFELLQERLSRQAEPGRQVESLKALYDLWVDAAEEAYAEIALSEEFREVYGEMVNAQMRVRKLQQQQLEATCRELGIPTRTEVSSLGERLQELRREMRVVAAKAAATTDDEVTALRAEVAALKRKLAGRSEPATASVKKTVSAPLDADTPRVRKPADRRAPGAATRAAARKRK